MRPFDKNLLCTTDRAAFTDIQGIGKDPLYMRYETVSAIINREIAPDFRSFIAMPQSSLLWWQRLRLGTLCREKEIYPCKSQRISS